MSIFKSLSETQTVDVVNSLLKNTSYDITSALNNTFLELVKLNIHYSAIELLLKDARVNPSIDSDSAIKHAVITNNPKLVELLLQNSSINPNLPWVYSGSLLEYASGYNFLEIVKILLKNDKLTPGDSNNYALRQASTFGHIEVVKLLLADKRINPKNNSGINSAMTNNHIEVVKLLIPKIDMSTITCPKILNLAKELEKSKSDILATGIVTGACNIAVGHNALHPLNKFIIDFINACPAKTPSEMQYVDNILTVKFNPTGQSVVSPSTKCIINFMDTCLAKNPFEIQYVSNILTVKYKV